MAKVLSESGAPAWRERAWGRNGLYWSRPPPGDTSSHSAARENKMKSSFLDTIHFSADYTNNFSLFIKQFENFCKL